MCRSLTIIKFIFKDYTQKLDKVIKINETQIQGIFAELDKSLLVKKLRKAREWVRKEKGKCEGPKKYGHTKEEAEILKKIRYMRRRLKDRKKLVHFNQSQMN